MGFDFDDIEGLDELQKNFKKLAESGIKELNKGMDRLNGKESKEASAVPKECPYCGAKLNIDSEEPVIVCEYCGAKFDNSSDRSIVDSVFDFVEKQQKVAMEEIARKQEMERARQEAKRARKKSHFFRNIVFLFIIIMALLYFYSQYMI